MKSNKEVDEIIKEARKRGGVKSLGDYIGLPTPQDREAIRLMLLQYDKRYPNRTLHTIQMARNEQFENSAAFKDIGEYGEIQEAGHRRHLFELPEDLVYMIETKYPLMFRNKKHFAWFCKNFPELRLSRKY